MIKLKCKVCENEFAPKKEYRYIATSIVPLTERMKFYDCFDCPECGCQVVAKERLVNENFENNEQ